MTEHDDLVARLIERWRGLPIDEVVRHAFGAIREDVESPVALSNAERLTRIRAVIAAVDAVETMDRDVNGAVAEAARAAYLPDE